MTWRALQVIATGQWCAPAQEAEAFPDDGKKWAVAVALALGLKAGELRVVDAAADPRTGQLLLEPEKPPEQPRISDLDKLIAAAKGSADFASFKQAIATLGDRNP